MAVPGNLRRIRGQGIRRRRSGHAWVHAAAVLALAAAVRLGSQGQAVGPPIPGGTLVQERRALAQAEGCLARGEFEKARTIVAALVVPPEVRVRVAWATAPPGALGGWRSAVEQALSVWNGALPGATRFTAVSAGETAEIEVVFDSQPAAVAPTSAALASPVSSLAAGPAPTASGVFDPASVTRRLAGRSPSEVDTVLVPAGTGGARRCARIRVPISPPGSAAPRTPEAVAHLVARGLGAYLGLANSDDPAGVMGSAAGGTRPAARPSASEVTAVAAVARTRAEVMDLAARRVAVRVHAPLMILPRSTLDGGTVWQGDTAHFEFQVRNDGAEPLEVGVKPYCGCTLTSVDRVVAPGSTGTIRAELRTVGLVGPVTKGMEVTTNDPVTPSAVLQVTANVRPLVEVLPTDRPVLALSDAGPTTLSLEVVLHRGGEGLSQVAASAAFAEVKAEPAAPDAAGSRYRVTVTVRADAPLGRSVFSVTAVTAAGQQPQALASVTCEKGIGATPLSVYLGIIGPGTSLPVSQAVTLWRSSGQFRVLSAGCDDAAVHVRQEPAAGGQHRIVVTYAGGWTAGIVRRKVVVDTDDPRQPRVEIPLLATVVSTQSAAGPAGR